ncbi:acyltransferase domain-containing protein [Nonomuraea antimicrobica]
MGVELAGVSPVFAARLEECGRALAPFVDFDVMDVLSSSGSGAGGGSGSGSGGVEGVGGVEGEGKSKGEGVGGGGLGSIEVLQPVLFAVGVALAGLWESLGVRPSAVVGHSLGEVGAACVAGVLSLEDAARVVALRSRLFGRELAGRGAIAAVGLSVGEVVGELGVVGGGLEVAACNGPFSCAVAGELGALEVLVGRLRGRGVRARVVGSTVASHSVMVEGLRGSWRVCWRGCVLGWGGCRCIRR